MGPGETFSFPDGTSICADEFLDHPRKGRKIVIMGDTRSGEHISALARGADVLVHEATNSWIPEVEMQSPGGARTAQDLERETRSHGHSTADMAGKFAAEIRAKTLILTHFSSRYCGDRFNPASLLIMDRIVKRAVNACKRKQEAHSNIDETSSADQDAQVKVIAAYDSMVFPISLPARRASNVDSPVGTAKDIS